MIKLTGLQPHSPNGPRHTEDVRRMGQEIPTEPRGVCQHDGGLENALFVGEYLLWVFLRDIRLHYFALVIYGSKISVVANV